MTDNELLIENVAQQITRSIVNERPDLQHDAVYEIAYDEAEYLCHDWPEGEGFGSSDSYGAYRNTLDRLAEADYDEPDVDELTEWMDFDPDC